MTMPELFYGTLPSGNRRRLYSGKPLTQIETGIYDKWKIRKLAPYVRLRDVGLFWWFKRKQHSALAWYDDRGKEQTVFVPQLLPQEQLLPLARDLFSDLLPPALTFRVLNERKPYTYD